MKLNFVKDRALAVFLSFFLNAFAWFFQTSWSLEKNEEENKQRHDKFTTNYLEITLKTSISSRRSADMEYFIICMCYVIIDSQNILN